MCGIAGIINFRDNIKDENRILERMVETLRDRGPDSLGYFNSNHVLLGHSRLIVVDPEGGKQPMTRCFEGFNYTIIYNGELYNTEDLRKELLDNGFEFKSYSDTEVLLVSYIYWGVDALKKFNGIFAFAIYDEKLQRVILARDAMGVKPLFYIVNNNKILFGSEIKTILADKTVKREVDREGLTELFALGPAVTPGTAIFKNIKEVEPAEVLIITNDYINKEYYWNLKAEEFNGNEKECVEHVQSLLFDSIKRQLVGDVPLCTFLSGGLDSSAISAIAAEEFAKRGKQLVTYSIDYEDNDKYFKSSLFQPTSDQYWALEMSKFINSEHRTIVLNHEDLARSIVESVNGRDLPGMADIDSSLYLFCKEIRKDFVVGLSGECADELFGGYPWYTNSEMKYADTFPWSRFVNKRKELLNSRYSNLPIEEYTKYQYEKTIKNISVLPTDSKEEIRMRELFMLNLRWFMITLLNRKDRMSMKNSLEVRVPFADYRLVEYAYNIPSKIKLFNGREKGLLRKSLEDVLPEEIIYRKKSPYPKTHNPIYTDIVCKMMQDILDKKSSPILEILNKDVLQEIVRTKGSSYTTPWYGQLMTGPQLIAYLASINMWLENYNINIIN